MDLMNGEDISSGMTLGVEGYVVTKEQRENRLAEAIRRNLLIKAYKKN